MHSERDVQPDAAVVQLAVQPDAAAAQRQVAAVARPVVWPEMHLWEMRLYEMRLALEVLRLESQLEWRLVQAAQLGQWHEVVVVAARHTGAALEEPFDHFFVEQMPELTAPLPMELGLVELGLVELVPVAPGLPEPVPESASVLDPELDSALELAFEAELAAMPSAAAWRIMHLCLWHPHLLHSQHLPAR